MHDYDDVSFTLVTMLCSIVFAVKGYLRKGAIHLGLKEASRAMDAYQKALDLDPNCQVRKIS